MEDGGSSSGNEMLNFHSFQFHPFLTISSSSDYDVIGLCSMLACMHTFLSLCACEAAQAHS